MQQTCQQMGAGADDFTDLALEFHGRADAIGEAARAERLETGRRSAEVAGDRVDLRASL